MNLQSHAKVLERLKDYSPDQYNRVLEDASRDMLSSIKKRVRDDGKNSLNESMGEYSTKPISVTQKQFVAGGFKAGGKSGRAKKTMYLPGGYKQLKQVQGLESKKVNASYSNETLDSYVLLNTGKRIFLGMNNKAASRKRKYLEEKYGPILTATKEEFLEYKAKVADGLRKVALNELRRV